MLKRGILLTLSLVVTFVSISAAAAVSAEAPRLGVLRLRQDLGGLEIATLDTTGKKYRRVAVQHLPKGFGVLRSLAWSPDGSLLAYTGWRKGEHPAIFMTPASGKGQPRAVPGTRGGDWPVFSPDGKSLAFARYRVEGARKHGLPAFESTSVWIVDLRSGKRRQLTRWRNDLFQYPSSFSPDGSTLLLERVDFQRSVEDEIVALRFDGRTSGLLVGRGEEPVYSPDGQKIVFAGWRERRVWSPKRSKWVYRPTSDLFTVDADGSNRRRLTHTPVRAEMLGGWDPSSERIVYTQFQGSPFQRGSTGAVMEMNADGTCPREILAKPGVILFSPVWQPGPSRGAGRIHC
jgi:Tol biopolymer transport system component